MTIGGKEHQFVRPTIGFVMKIQSMNFEDKFSSTDFSEKGIKKTRKAWGSFCRLVFVKKWWWFFRLPKELRFENLTVKEFQGVLESFFMFVGVEIQGNSGNETSSNSPTESE